MATSCSSLDELASLRLCVCTWWWSLKLGGHYLLCCLALGKDKTCISLFSPELGLSVESLCVLYFSSELLFAFEKTGNDSSFFSSSSMECLLDSKRVRQSARVTDRTDNIAWWNVKSRVWKCLVKSVSFFFLFQVFSLRGREGIEFRQITYGIVNGPKMVECFWLLSPHRSLRKWIKTRSSMSCPLALWRSRRIDSTVSHFHNQQTERKRRKRRGKSWHAFLPFSPIVNELAAAPSALPWRHTLKLDAVRFRAAILQSKSAMTRLSLRMNRRCRDAAIHYVSFFLCVCVYGVRRSTGAPFGTRGCVCCGRRRRRRRMASDWLFRTEEDSLFFVLCLPRFPAGGSCLVLRFKYVALS